MKIISYRHAAEVRGGILHRGQVYDLEALLELWVKPGEATSSVREFLDRFGGRIPDFASHLGSLISRAKSAHVGSEREVSFEAPLHDPGKILCIGLNYRDHVSETGRALPEYPDVFAKFASTMIGPRDEIGGADVSDNLDFEGEVAVVIGSEARRVTEDQALRHVAGLVPLNDVTARDLQYRGTQWLAGKSVDGSTPWGPAIVTLDEVGDPQTLDVVTRVNGVEMQRSNTKHQIFSIAAIISYLSSFLTLSPGDVIATGTPQGIGAKRTPPVWLHPDDEVEIEIGRVGVLRNRVGTGT